LSDNILPPAAGGDNSRDDGQAGKQPPPGPVLGASRNGQPPPDFAAELLEAARRLRAGGMSAFNITLELGRLNAQRGWQLREVISIVRQLPGLEGYSAVGEWAERMRKAEPPAVRLWEDEPSDAPVGPSHEEANRRRQGQRFAGRFTRYEPEVKPVLLDMLAPSVGEIAAEVAERVLRRKETARG
jgi:hypothetical protein